MPAMVMAMADIRGLQADVHIHAAPGGFLQFPLER